MSVVRPTVCVSRAAKQVVMDNPYGSEGVLRRPFDFAQGRLAEPAQRLKGRPKSGMTDEYLVTEP
ncbi:MAG TPA: hypothetical protein VJL59_24215 [Anaerolineales bacterium]|nr:hypothetical protein [Anaerolineales bacterium]